jgi:hypothetical protein
MSEVTHVSDHSIQRTPIMLQPAAIDALREAIQCLDTADQALRRRRVEHTDEVLALLQAAASHLEHAWDRATDPAVPPHMRGAE